MAKRSGTVKEQRSRVRGKRRAELSDELVTETGAIDERQTRRIETRVIVLIRAEVKIETKRGMVRKRTLNLMEI